MKRNKSLTIVQVCQKGTVVIASSLFSFIKPFKDILQFLTLESAKGIKMLANIQLVTKKSHIRLHGFQNNFFIVASDHATAERTSWAKRCFYPKSF